MSCTSCGSSKPVISEQFPAGLRVLVVDDDVIWLRVLEKMLRNCMYNVTCCSQATGALDLLRERKGGFDIILSDVHMPDMDGFKLLELVGLEMDLPVIMMSADGRTNLVMRGIRHGACDYLIKPVRDEELKNLWQHVVRKKWNESKEHDHSGSIEDNEKRVIDDAEYASSVNEGGDGALRTQKKRRDIDEDGTELENDDPTMAKKPRVVWSVELHQQFVSAVNQLGIDKAVPKRILEMMNVPGLTRENVASHLQKFRLYLKRLSGVAQQHGGLPNSYCGPVQQNLNLASLGIFDIRELAASGQLPPQTLAALHAELLSRPEGNLILGAMDQSSLLQGSTCIPVDRNMAYDQPLIKRSSNISKQFSQPIMSNLDVQHEASGLWPSKSPSDMVPACNLGSAVETDISMLMSLMQQQQKQLTISEPLRTLNVQPSCLVVPSPSSASFQAVNSPASVNQNCTFINSPLDYKSSFQSNISSGVGQILDAECKPVHMLPEFSAAGSVTSMSPCSKIADVARQRAQSSPSSFNAARHLPVIVPDIPHMQGSCNSNLDKVLNWSPISSNVYVGKGTSIPSRFAIDEHELPTSNMKSHLKLYNENNSNRVKPEPNMESESITVPQHVFPDDLMRVSCE